MLALLFNPLANAIMTALAGLSALYWLFTFLLGDWLGSADVGADFDTDVELDVDGSGGIAEATTMDKVLEYVNIGKVPFMVVLSVFKFIAWIGTLASSVLLCTASWGWKSVLLLIPIFIIAYFVTRWATKPLVKIYKEMGYNGEEAHDLLGRTALMRSSISGDKLGNAELRINTDLIRINVRSADGSPIAYNQQVTIVDERKAEQVYLVRAELSLDQI